MENGPPTNRRLSPLWNQVGGQNWLTDTDGRDSFERPSYPLFTRLFITLTVYLSFFFSPFFFWIFSLFCSGRNQMTSRNLVETSTRQLSRNTFHSRYSCRTANEGQQLEHVLMTTSDDYSTSPDVCFGALLSKKAFTAYPLPSSPSFTDDEWWPLNGRKET